MLERDLLGLPSTSSSLHAASSHAAAFSFLPSEVRPVARQPFLPGSTAFFFLPDEVCHSLIVMVLQLGNPSYRPLSAVFSFLRF